MRISDWSSDVCSSDLQLVLAVIAIESRYNPYAESHVGAQGLMQVMTKVHKDKFEVFSDGPIAALNPIANIRVGTQILYDCIKRRRSIEGGQIGRGSCRERVCQYVWISGVAGSLKKKKKI